MKRIIAFILLLQLFPAVVHAQIIPPDTMWTFTFGEAGFDEGRAVVQTADGGYVITGSYTFVSSKVFLVKTDSSGTPVWERNYGGIGTDEGYDVRETSDGGFIIAGATTSYGAGMSDVYLIRTNSTGDTLWTRTFGTALNDKGFGVRPTIDGGYIITGYTTEEVDGAEVYLVKADSLGNLEWDYFFGGGMDDYGYSVEETSDGGFIVTGSKASFIDSTNVYLLRTDPAGGMSWEQDYGAEGSDAGKGVIPTADGGYIITGYTASGITDDPSDIYLIKTDDRGDTLWTNTYGGDDADEGASIYPTVEGGYIITGYTASGGTDSYQAIMISVDAQGNEIWTKYLGGAGNEGCYSVKQADDGTYVVAGFTDSYGSGGSDAWMVRVNAHQDVLVGMNPLNPPLIVPAGGGEFQFEISLLNNTNGALSTDFWTQIYKPGQFVVPILNMPGLNLGPGIPVVRERNQNIPAYAPGGEYIYYGFCGTYPWVVDNRDQFTFIKQGADHGGPGDPADWICGGEKFAGETSSEAVVPSAYRMITASPNPFNNETTISFSLPGDSEISLVIYNLEGREITELAGGYYPAGIHTIGFDAGGLSSGIYFAVLQSDNTTNTLKLLLLK